jgi:uncharacterized lipoprotein YajG
MRKYSFNAGIGIALVFALFVSGCAFSTANVDLAYQPEAGSKSPLATLSPMKIALQVDDERPTSERESVGNKRNGFGSITASVTSKKSVLTVIYEALKNEFAGNGHSIVQSKDGSSDALIRVALKRYWTDVAIHFWDVEVTGTLNADVGVRGRVADKVFLTKPIQSASRDSRQIVTDSAYETVLNAALTEFIRNVSRDPALIKALQEARASAEGSNVDIK